MGWSFAIINNKLAEVFFEKKRGKIKFQGHVFVKKSEYSTREEQKWIEKDTKKVNLTFREGKYTRLTYEFITVLSYSVTMTVPLSEDLR